MKRSPSRRARVARRAVDKARVAPAPGTSRARVALALDACTASERALLSLLLTERLTVPEAAEALERAPRDVTRAYARLLTELRRTVRGAGFRPAISTTLDDLEPRRAS
jgi:DNA-directed RNA polymerase specialized sigma24 family protein